MARSTQEVMDSTGASRRQVEFWIQRGYIKFPKDMANPGTGKDRQWSLAQYKKASHMSVLTGLGISAAAASRIADMANYRGEGVWGFTEDSFQVFWRLP